MKEILDRLDQFDTSFQRIDDNFRQIDRRFQQINDRFEQIDGRFEQIDDRFEQIDGRFEQIDGRFEQIDGRFEQIDGRFEQFDGRFERLEDKVDAGFQKQGVQLEALQGDMKQALEGISGNREVLDDKFAEVLRKLDERVQPVELASRHFAREIASLQPRPRTKRKKQA